MQFILGVALETKNFKKYLVFFYMVQQQNQSFYEEFGWLRIATLLLTIKA